MEAVGARSGRDVVAKVWRLFVSQVPDALFKLETLAAGSDPAAIAKQAHLLKSMALSSGAARLAAVCEDLEQESKTGQIDDAPAKLALARTLLEETRGLMENSLAGPPAAVAR